MAHQRSDSYLQDSIGLFTYYKKLGEAAIAQCPDAGLVATLDDEANSIGIIVKHMTGNMRSRWTDFLTSDGEKADRNRDSEFEEAPKTRGEILDLWDAGWKCVFSALEALHDSDLTKTVKIRGEEHSVMQAINRQIAHYSYHIGQIVLLAKHFAGAGWKSLSVPKNQSKQFTADVQSGRKSQR
ncbi:MAG TPA: DUF1572 family protein [Dongiaceae bacterium]|nr:DUF1572 family protein [Dongiaceae bacterium]